MRSERVFSVDALTNTAIGSFFRRGRGFILFVLALEDV